MSDINILHKLRAYPSYLKTQQNRVLILLHQVFSTQQLNDADQVRFRMICDELNNRSILT